MRRTSTVDILWPEGFAGPLVIRGRGRDIRTLDDGGIEVLGRASTEIVLEAGKVTSMATEPAVPIDGFIGISGRGFRRAVEEHTPELATDGSLLGLLLDEVPVALVISTYSLARGGLMPRPAAAATGTGPVVHPRSDVCAGWAADAIPPDFSGRPGHDIMLAPKAALPRLTRDDDPLAWHEQPPLPAGSMRRRRRLDLSRTVDGDLVIDSLFRDAYRVDDELEHGVHEYGVEGIVDGQTLTLRSITITPRVLPRPACTNALASAQRLVGHTLPELRAHVRAEFAGTSTCTHLNDELRAVGDLHALVAHL